MSHNNMMLWLGGLESLMPALKNTDATEFPGQDSLLLNSLLLAFQA